LHTHEIRKRFLDHFVNAGHTEVPSASVILEDPNLLFVNAGMVQFVPFFLGQRTPPYATATSIQKCIRTPDIDEVGITTRSPRADTAWTPSGCGRRCSTTTTRP